MARSDTLAVDNVSLDLARGSLVSLLGASGSADQRATAEAAMPRTAWPFQATGAGIGNGD
jgi:ABC-type dipeptide/oligopeptide/nickel transport system ATPase component